MSNKGPFVSPPKYMTDYSKALASEIKILLQEVGKLRDERQQLQYEIADLMATRSKYGGGGGGYIGPAWGPKREPTPPPPTPPPQPLAIEDVEPARPAWRTVQKRPEGRRPKQKAIAAPPPPPMPEPPAPANLPAWAQWRPNPLHSPQPQLASPSGQPAMIPPRAGLFGTPSPPP